MQFTLHRGQSSTDLPRKLSFKKETLRQLTDGELRQVAGGGTSASASASSGTSAISSGTSVIAPSTSVQSPGSSVISRH